MDKSEFGVAQGGSGILAGVEVRVELIHQLRSGSVADFPEPGNDVVSAGTEKRPGETDETLSGVGFGTGAVAGRNGDEVCGERMFDDVAGIELKGVSFGRKDDGRIEGLKAARRAVRREVEIREVFRMTVDVIRGRGLGSGRGRGRGAGAGTRASRARHARRARARLGRLTL